MVPVSVEVRLMTAVSRSLFVSLLTSPDQPYSSRDPA